MSQRTLWEEGHEPGRQVAVLGVAVTLTVAVLDLLSFGELTLLFDLSFVLVCLALALLVRPRDFFTVGVLPPLLMVGTFTFLGLIRPEAIADRDDGVVQAVVSGLGHHAGALIIGYGLSLGVLAVRQRVLRRSGLVAR
ncbi:DUF6542 domain-containing protein [Nocardioides sp. YIM 152315]|uniref:DUF6542 domain-containing protein n=1 Tax=Nocardioides sp. YIM 152315 TaxID=3031760 RepID=UPI0023D9DCA1|nr:DUF6542 domain-containing protein [Nocardioides sp. YIM 152315]MDF1605371.1 hypothetical protein [Nocardioides sp. YIM 152315]